MYFVPVLARIPGGAADCWLPAEIMEARCWIANSFSGLSDSSVVLTEDSMWFRYFSTTWLFGADNDCVPEAPVKPASVPKSGWWWCFMRRSTTPAPWRGAPLELLSVDRTPFVSLRRWGLRTWTWGDSCMPTIIKNIIYLFILKII